MGFVSGTVAFVIIWWMVFFMALPFGNQPPEEVETGHMDGAPAKPRLAKKALVTTGISLVLFAAYYAFHESGLFTFRTPVE